MNAPPQFANQKELITEAVLTRPAHPSGSNCTFATPFTINYSLQTETIKLSRLADFHSNLEENLIMGDKTDKNACDFDRIHMSAEEHLPDNFFKTSQKLLPIYKLAYVGNGIVCQYSASISS